MSLSVIPLTILGQITGVTGSGDTVLYQVSFKSIDGTPLYGVTAVWTDEQAEIEALAAEKPYGVWINPIDGTFTVKFADYTYVGTADLTDDDVLSGVTPIEFTTTEVSDRLLPEVDAEDAGKIMIVSDEGEWELGSIPEELPDVTAADDGKMLQVVDGEWTPVEPLILSDYPAELQTLFQTAIQTNMANIIQGAGNPYYLAVMWKRDNATDKTAFDTFADNIISIVNNKNIPAYGESGFSVTGRNAGSDYYFLCLAASTLQISTYKFIISYGSVMLNHPASANPDITVNITIALLSSAS